MLMPRKEAKLAEQATAEKSEYAAILGLLPAKTPPLGSILPTRNPVFESAMPQSPIWAFWEGENRATEIRGIEISRNKIAVRIDSPAPELFDLPTTLSEIGATSLGAPISVPMRGNPQLMRKDLMYADSPEGGFVAFAIENSKVVKQSVAPPSGSSALAGTFLLLPNGDAVKLTTTGIIGAVSGQNGIFPAAAELPIRMVPGKTSVKALAGQDGNPITAAGVPIMEVTNGTEWLQVIILPSGRVQKKPASGPYSSLR